MKEYIKKPEVIEAVQFTSYDPDEISKILEWANCNPSSSGRMEKALMLDISGSIITVQLGDWIIKDASGYMHSCSPDTFNLLYERVSYEYPY